MAGKSDALASSTVIVIVELADILPPLLLPVFTGSFIPITCPGLTITPDDKSTVKVTVSVRFCSVNLTHRAKREA